MSEQEENGRIVELPDDPLRLPPERLPLPLGRVAAGHPLRRPLLIALLVLVVLFAGYFATALFGGFYSRSGGNEPVMFSETYRQPGAITYQGKRLHGWFLDSERQHFQAEDGRRFTFVDSHEREGFPVRGHWRLME